MDDSDSGESSAAGETLEVAEILGQQILLPQGLAENSQIFYQVLSPNTWNTLSPNDVAHLMKFLPTFPENDAQEKSITLRRLFNRANFKFGSPLETFHDQLERGHFRPDIAQLHRLIKRAQRRQYKDQRKRRYYSLLKQLIVSRRELLELASNTSPGPLKLPRSYNNHNPAGDPVQHRVKKRYFQELAAVRSEVGEFSHSSEDELYADRAPRTLSKKQRHKLQQLEHSLACSDMRAVTSTLATKPDGFDLQHHVTSLCNPYEVTDEAFKKMLAVHRKKRSELAVRSLMNMDMAPDIGKDVALRNPVDQKRPMTKVKRKGGSTTRIKFEPASLDTAYQGIGKKVKKELVDELTKKSEESTDEELVRALDRSDGERNIDVESASPTNIPQNQQLQQQQQDRVMSTTPSRSISAPPPTSSPNSVNIPPPQSQPMVIVKNSHVCFFSLLRDLFCSSPLHRLGLERLEIKLKTWERDPAVPLNNEWFTLIDQPWSSLLYSAIKFLSGLYPADIQPEDFVPYMEFKASNRAYQWIGAGRDSDSHLLALCSYWLDHREALPPPSAPLAEPDADPEEDVLPPPRCPTNWTVRPSTEEEKLEFQNQEKERFHNPGRAFTYRLHGYESVVGPVKGIYSSQSASSSVLKPRGHNLLSLNRPSYVTVLALVRDAAARLPNGEGTRADMCTLLRDSQYLDVTGAEESTLQGVVSGALDRLHYEVDACVRFDTKRKVWLYLHRGRSEAEMEKMHQQHQNANKICKKTLRKKQGKKTELGLSNESSEKSVRRLKGDSTVGPAKEKDPIEKPPRRAKVTPRQTAKSVEVADSEPASSNIMLQAPLSGRVAVKSSEGTSGTGTGAAQNPLLLAASGQKVQIIASGPHNMGHIQSIQLSTAPNNIQILTSSGQIVARPVTTSDERLSVPTTAESRGTVSLLTCSQDKDKQSGKLPAQILNMSGVHLLNKNNASPHLLTGVKLVNTHQGVKMVATSATTVVQTAIPTQKTTATVAKSLQAPRTTPQIISMEALVQGARASVSKGQTSLIQLPQFAVVSQGSLQPRIVSAMTAQRAIATGSTSTQVKTARGVTLAGIKPVILTKAHAQSQNVILTADNSGGGQALVLSSGGGVRGQQPVRGTIVPRGVRASTPGTVTVVPQSVRGTAPGAVTVIPQGVRATSSGAMTQQILLPGTLNLRGLQGLKVIPLSSGSGQKVYARFVKAQQSQPQGPQPSSPPTPRCDDH